jgi:hypothetical protein
MDEKRGRATAEARGLNVIGLLGVLLLAKKARHLASVDRLIAELEFAGWLLRLRRGETDRFEGRWREFVIRDNERRMDERLRNSWRPLATRIFV